MLAVPAAATAGGEPERIDVKVSDEFVDEYLSTARGTPVTGSAEGTVSITLWRNDAGPVVRDMVSLVGHWPDGVDVVAALCDAPTF